MEIIEQLKMQINEVGINSDLVIQPEKTLLLVVDVMNETKEEGVIKKKLGMDISMFQNIERNIVQLASACKSASIPVACVTCVYDSEYMPPAMSSRFEAMGLAGTIAPKGAWDSQVIDELLLLDPEYIVVKSHFSAFSIYHSFVYKPGTNKALEEYLMLPTEADKKVKSEGRKTMRDYFQEACNLQSENIEQYLDNGGVASLDGILRERGVQTLIITGGSTHVCQDAAVCAAFDRGYEIIEPLDAVASEESEKHVVYLHNHGYFKTQITTTQKILEALNAG